MELIPKITVTWVNDTEILLWKFEPYWDWLSFQQAINLSRRMILSTSKPVVEIMDFSEGGQIPPDTLTEGRKVFGMNAPENLSMIVGYGLDGYARSAYRVLTYITPIVYIAGWNVKFADDFKSAYAIAYQQLYSDVASPI